MISIHASREGSDVHEAVRPRRTSQFQSTLPAREATQSSLVTSPFTIFQSTLPAREATNAEHERFGHKHISIHASREGSDFPVNKYRAASGYFNPRFPRGKRPKGRRRTWKPSDFNPRFPRGKRLSTTGRVPRGIRDFNPRFPRGKRRRVLSAFRPYYLISIHASREGSDARSGGHLSYP